MKINFAQLFPHLHQQQQPAPIYLLSGDETILLDNAKHSIYQYVHRYGFTQREVFYIETMADWQSFMLSAYNSSLFSTQQLLELRLSSVRLGEKGNKALQEYALRPPRDTVLVLMMPKVDAATQKSKWFKAIEKSGTVVQIWALANQHLLNWIANKAQHFGLHLSHQSIQIIAEHTAGNLLATQQEIEKLSLLYGVVNSDGQKRTIISDKQVVAALSDNARFNIFTLTDVIYTRNKAQIVNVLEHLSKDSIEPTLVLWALTREIRMLLDLKKASFNATLLDQRLGCPMYKIKNDYKPKIKQLLSLLTTTHLESLLQRAACVDWIIKGVEKGNVWRELQLIAINLSVI